MAYLFERVGEMTLLLSAASEERVLEVILEAGARELSADDDHHIIITPPDQLYAVAEALKQAGLETDSQKLTFIPQTTSAVDDTATARRILLLCEALEENDDVLNVHSNAGISDDVLAGFALH